MKGLRYLSLGLEQCQSLKISDLSELSEIRLDGSRGYGTSISRSRAKALLSKIPALPNLQSASIDNMDIDSSLVNSILKKLNAPFVDFGHSAIASNAFEEIAVQQNVVSLNVQSFQPNDRQFESFLVKFPPFAFSQHRRFKIGTISD